MMFWVIVAVVGLVLYTNPSMMVRHMYEGFNTQQQKAQPPNQSQGQTQQQAPLNVNSMLRNLEQLIGTPGMNPDTHPSMPSDELPQQHISNTGREQPQESDGQSSRPQSVEKKEELSQALEQGRAFQQTKPQPVKEIIKERIVEVPRACPPQQPQQECPVCPDMRNYIRKDSIPCWACKL